MTVAEKPKPDRKKWMAVQYVGNFIGCLIVTPIMAAVVFKMFGDGSGDILSVRAFTIGLITCFTVIQCHGATINTRKDFLRGKWIAGDGADNSGKPVFNPWKRIAPFALPAGFAAAAAAYFAVPLMGEGPLGMVHINLPAFVFLLIASTTAIALGLPGDQTSMVAALKSPGREGPLPFSALFLLEYSIPWMIIQGVINFGIGVKQFGNELLKPAAIEAGGVPAGIVAVDFGAVFWILLFFMWLVSDVQVRPDVRLGRVSMPLETRLSRLMAKGALPVVGLLLFFVVLSTLARAIVTAAFFAAGVETLSMMEAAVIKTLSAVFATVAGCAIGIWWGARREAHIINIERAA